MPEFLMGNYFVQLDWAIIGQVVLMGFIGGTLSGFIGCGGAFFITPGMMNIGVPGPVAVASNTAHKLGKAMIGSREHGKMGHVDKKLAIFMLITAALGINLAIWVIKTMFAGSGGEGAGGGAWTDLYISLVFSIVLAFVSMSMLKDLIHSIKSADSKPSRKIVKFLYRLNLHPMINFQVADVKVSLWVVMICGLATGYLAGTIGVGGFIGVPAMIYVFGVSSQVAAGTEMYLAMFMGAYGTLNFALHGMVDLRLTLLLYLGSLIGIHLGVYGTKVVREIFIRLVTALIILVCVISRVIAIPVYLRKLGYLDYPADMDIYFNTGSSALLYVSGIGGMIMILFFVFKAYLQRSKVRASLVATREKSSAVPAGS